MCSSAAATAAPALPPAGTVTCGADTVSFPDVDIVCADCTVLVGSSAGSSASRFITYGSCENYCASIGRTCVGAAEEFGDACVVSLPDIPCTENVSATNPNYLCECAGGSGDGLSSLPRRPPLACPASPKEVTKLWTDDATSYDKFARPPYDKFARPPSYRPAPLAPTLVYVLPMPLRLGAFDMRLQTLAVEIDVSIVWDDVRLSFNETCLDDLGSTNTRIHIHTYIHIGTPELQWDLPE